MHCGRKLVHRSTLTGLCSVLGPPPFCSRWRTELSDPLPWRSYGSVLASLTLERGRSGGASGPMRHTPSAPRGRVRGSYPWLRRCDRPKGPPRAPLCAIHGGSPKRTGRPSDAVRLSKWPPGPRRSRASDFSCPVFGLTNPGLDPDAILVQPPDVAVAQRLWNQIQVIVPGPPLGPDGERSPLLHREAPEHTLDLMEDGCHRGVAIRESLMEQVAHVSLEEADLREHIWIAAARHC